jgi:O-methyltransferase involved in polyketide biosynthesis
MYLPADAQDRLFEQITELSAPGSRLSVEAIRHHDEQRRERMRERWQKMADDIGIERNVDIADLTYNDPDRADATEWLGAHGWDASGTSSTDEMRRLNRWTEVPEEDYQDGFSTFVIAQRHG